MIDVLEHTYFMAKFAPEEAVIGSTFDKDKSDMITVESFADQESKDVFIEKVRDSLDKFEEIYLVVTVTE